LITSLATHRRPQRSARFSIEPEHIELFPPNGRRSEGNIREARHEPSRADADWKGSVITNRILETRENCNTRRVRRAARLTRWIIAERD